MRPITPDRIKMLAKGQGVRGISSGSTILKFVIAFNILLALYNFMCFSVPRQQPEPCVVVLNNTELKNAAEKGLVRLSDTKYVDLTRKQSLIETTNRSTDISNRTHSQFAVIENYFKAKGADVEFDKSVTYTTQATHEFFFPHIDELCDRWGGPISLSIYAPGRDFEVANKKLAHLIKCSPCVAKNVTFHMVYHVDHVPSNISADSEAFLASFDVDCLKVPEDDSNYRKDMKLTYPINVLRNVARTNAKTRYVLASDIELYPSENIIPKFINMVEKQPLSNGVYTLPIFEVDKSHDVPRTKTELRRLYAEQKSVFFHKFVCDMCQNFPYRDKWIAQEERNSSSLAVFATTKRRKDRSSWEPIYIGTNDEPLYAEELTWEGKRDKMSQMFELCLRDYDFRVLDDAFLCHAPGIKRITKKELTWRLPFVRTNNARYPNILAAIKRRNVKGINPAKCI